LLPIAAHLCRANPAAGLIVLVKIEALAVRKPDFVTAALRHNFVFGSGGLGPFPMIPPVGRREKRLRIVERK
jgi:hypothetical protein